MTRIYVDAGHGGTDPGGMGNGLKEKDLTLKIALKIKGLLDKYKVDVRLSRTSDKTMSLSERTTDANNWKADYLLSVHINGYGDRDGDGDGDGYGYEDFIWDKLSDSSETAKLQDVMHKELKSLFSKDRGAKKANFHMLRVSTMPAILTENGFIDRDDDAELLKSDAFLNKVAKAHVAGLVKAFNLKLIPVKVVAKPTPTKSKATHTHYSVRLGDTLTSIAKEYKVGVGEIVELNPDIKNRNQIFVNQILNIPIK